MIEIYILYKNNVPFYIGYSKNTNKRIISHRRKYGYDIDFDIIDTCLNTNKKYIETFWICLFKSWGFKLENKNEGGGGPLFQTEKTKQIKREKAMGNQYAKGKKQNPLAGSRKSKALKGKPKPEGFGDMMRQVRLGKSKPKYMGEKVSKALKGKPKEKLYKSILQFDLNNNLIKEWPSIKHAAQGTNSNASTISKVCRGIFKKTNGYIYKYK
jgi:hypothetical protein